MFDHFSVYARQACTNAQELVGDGQVTPAHLFAGAASLLAVENDPGTYPRTEMILADIRQRPPSPSSKAHIDM